MPSKHTISLNNGFKWTFSDAFSSLADSELQNRTDFPFKTNF